MPVDTNTGELEKVRNDPNFYRLDPAVRREVWGQIDPHFKSLNQSIQDEVIKQEQADFSKRRAAPAQPGAITQPVAAHAPTRIPEGMPPGMTPSQQLAHARAAFIPLSGEAFKENSPAIPATQLVEELGGKMPPGASTPLKVVSGMGYGAADIITGILAREGGYTDNAADKGGPTNFGITLQTLSGWRGHACTADDVEAMTAAEARTIYEARYIVLPHFDQITDDALRVNLIDWGVTSWIVWPVKALQRALGFTPSAADGVLGPVTLAAANGRAATPLCASILAQRAAFYRAYAAANPSQAQFLAGWLNRCRALGWSGV